MSKELVIGSNRHETKVAILEDDQLSEIYFQRANEYSLAGSIHKGKVTRVLPGMQSAFVDLGLERDTFLYVSDFFEENDDIDTVADEKPAAERRERGGRYQPQRVAAAEPLPATVASPAEAPIENGRPDTPAAAAPLTDAPERQNFDRPAPDRQPAGERAGADRNLRGDRRGRRSRRRRSRPGGFPENKYAQAGASAAPAPESHPVAHSEAEETAEARDVIILPGESLAKYRHLASAPESEQHEAELHQSQIDETDDPAAEEEILAEAEEIELTDKVFSNHPESPAEKEDKIAEVRHDQPSPFLVDDIDEEEEPAAESAASEGAQRPEASHRYGVFGVTGEAEVVEREATAAPELEDEEADEAESLPEPFDPEDAIEADEDLPERQELVALLEDEAPNGSAATEEGSAPQAQTASVREGGARYMHRVSRRMRRRRGGNRPNPNEGPVEARAFSAGAGAAAGLQPEAKVQSEEAADERPERVYPSITELLKPGQEIIVQIAKEPLGTKGARITSHIALPGRFVVFMPSVNHVGVSRKIASDEERQRLKRILQTHRVGTTGGFIVRTAGEGIPEEEIAADMDFLYRLWMDIRQKAEKRPAPMLLHCDLDVVQRVLRDQVTEEFKSIWVDNEEMYENVLSFMQRFQPALVSRVKMYTRSAPIFDAFGITQELEKALRPKVWLKSGGYIVINQTEALVAIDINTGKYVGKSNRLEDTIVKTNLEAVKEIARQVRLRDLGGIIVVDFIDMDERKNRQKVMQALEEAMRADRAPYKILQFNDFGLVAITRKRVKQSLERTLCSPCPYCEGAGYVKSVQTVIGEILVEAQKLAKAIEGKDVLLRVHPEVAKVLKANDNHFLEEIEESLAKPVLVKGDPALHIEKFDLG